VAEAEIRERTDHDLANSACALRRVYEADTYPTVWPPDPQGWLNPPGVAAAWVAVSPDVAECGGIIGHVLLRESTDSQVYELGRLFVTPSGRGLRLGEALIAKAQGWAAPYGRQLMLEVTAASERSHAEALYERTGWRKIGTSIADWTASDGSPVQKHRYVR
jgi:GNAT superfamily N-acetyltransferase